MDYETRSKQFGFASKEKIESLVQSHVLSKAITPLFLDVRTPAEIVEAPLILYHISVAHISVSTTDTSALESTIHTIFPNKEAPIIAFCRSGRRSSVAKLKLEEMGYQQVYNAGGLADLIYLNRYKDKWC